MSSAFVLPVLWGTFLLLSAGALEGQLATVYRDSAPRVPAEEWRRLKRSMTLLKWLGLASMWAGGWFISPFPIRESWGWIVPTVVIVAGFAAWQTSRAVLLSKAMRRRRRNP